MSGTDSFCCFSLRPELRVIWELTGACDLRCIHCHRSNFTQYGLPTEKVLSVITDLREIGVENIIFSGGEPLLRRDLFEILAYAKEAIGDLDLCTNAQRMTPEIAMILGKVLCEVSVSLDGFEDAHDFVRGVSGAFRKTVQGIELLARAGLEVHLICVPFKGVNDTDLEDFISFVQRIGAQSVSFLRLLPVGLGAGLSRFFLEREDRSRLMEEVRRLREQFPNFPINTKRLADDAPLGQCPAGTFLLGISAEGMVTTCPVGGKPLGTVECLKEFCPTKMDSFGQVCRSCPLRSCCFAGCPAEGKPDVLCNVGQGGSYER